MSTGHATALLVPGDTVVHRLRPECKVLGVFLFVLVVVATPGDVHWAFGLYALLLAGVIRAAGLALRTVTTRTLIETPFVLFAVALPFLEGGEQVQVLSLSLSAHGLQAAFTILAKGTLGVVASVVLAATTDLRDLLRGMERLRLSRTLVMIMGFMIRYLDVIVGEANRMRIARVSRGYDPRWLWQARALASSAGTLFIRSYERGERVYLAMLSRGYTGSIPSFGGAPARAREWVTGLALPAAATAVAILAWSTHL